MSFIGSLVGTLIGVLVVIVLGAIFVVLGLIILSKLVRVLARQFTKARSDVRQASTGWRSYR